MLSRPLFLASATLLAVGLLLGISTNLAKVAHGVGLAPLPYLAWSVCGAALIVTLIACARGHGPRLNRRTAEYFFVSGFLTIAGANLIFFSAVPHLGVGFVALMISLPPLLTYAGALALRMETFCSWRAAGVVLALAGTAFLVLRQWALPQADARWILLCLVAPALLAAGNLYRSRRWPPGESAASLAPGMLLGATVVLAAFALMPGSSLALNTESPYAAPLIALQAVVFAAQFGLLFVLQRLGGPVFMSLMGAVSAVFGVPIAMLLPAEPPVPALLPSGALIAAGIGCMLFGVKACRR